MGTSLYEQYQREKGRGQKPETLHEKYQRERSQSDSDSLFRENGLLGQTDQPPLRLDVRQPTESTHGAPYDPKRPGDFEALKSAPGSFLPWLAGGVAPAAALALTAAQGVPGMESLEAAAGSLGSKFTKHPMTFGESRDVLRERSAELLPSEIRTTAKIMGSGLALPLVAGLTPLKAGAAIGGADQALSADDMSMGTRLARTAAGAAAGGAAGKVVETGVLAARAGLSPNPGASALARQDAMGVADNAAYGAAEREAAAAGGSHPAIANALNQPTVAPFAKAVRQTEQFANADDATILAETYKLMSETQRRLGRTMVNSEDYRAGSSLQKAELVIAKKNLLDAADNIMPGFRKAVEQHAKMAGEADALAQGAQTTRRLVMKNSGNTAKLTRQSPEAFSRRIEKMTPEEKKAAIQGMLGELKTRIGLQPNAISFGGALTTAIRPSRVAPYLRKLGGMERQDEVYKRALLASVGAIDR